MMKQPTTKGAAGMVILVIVIILIILGIIFYANRDDAPTLENGADSEMQIEDGTMMEDETATDTDSMMEAEGDVMIETE